MGWAEQLPSGSYRALYRDRSGKRRSAGTFPHKRAAEKAADVAEDAARRVGYRDPRSGELLWGDWVAAWWPTRPVEPGTLHRDQYRRDLHLLPRWADVALIDITRHDVKAWAATLGKTLAPASVQRIVYMLSASLNAAIDAEIITANPAFRIRIARGQTSSERYLTHDEFDRLLEQMDTPYDRALASVLAGTGLRWGEAAGLQLHRIDFETGMLRVAEVWDDDQARLKPYPKSGKIRNVPAPDWVMELLEDLVTTSTITGGLLFARSTGRPIAASNWRRRVWTEALTSAQVEPARVHDLRHTCASWLIQDGWSLAEVGQHLGHASAQTTQIYAHLLPTDRGRVLRAIRRPRRGADVGQSPAPLRSITRAETAANPASSHGA